MAPHAILAVTSSASCAATDGRRAFHDRVRDGIRKFLEDRAMEGKTGAREFYGFEEPLHDACSKGRASRRRRAMSMLTRSRSMLTRSRSRGGWIDGSCAAGRPT
jgi:hypothetical protein